MSRTPVDYHAFAGQLQRLASSLRSLEPLATTLGVSSPGGQEWFELLQKKLLPQLELPPLLIVAIVGGTNIGKSAVFNHLAGEIASAVSPLAAGTKHPVCLVPPGADDPVLLEKLFEPFQLRAWQSPADALREAEENLVFWRVGAQMPPRLLALDAPDVDSDVTVNWERARAIRQVADVLVAVLTQQKYNDAAVKQFFRAAVEADKPVIVVFNQCDLMADREYWPQWLATFQETTGARPELIYLVPYERAAVDTLQLPFFRFADGDQGWPRFGGEVPRSNKLREDLASLHFDAIKIRTFRGALGRVLDQASGLPAYLGRIQAAAAQFAGAAAALSATEMARVAWPTLPARVLVDEIRRWWDASRAPWSKRIHGFYHTLGRGVTWPVRTAWEALAGPTSEPLAAFQQQERQAIVLAVEAMLDELNRLAQVGNETLRPRLMQLLGGDARSRLLARVQLAHEELPSVDDHYREFLTVELDGWRRSNPRAVRFLQSLDHVLALARPAITISLAVSGWVVAGDLVGQAAVHVAGHTVGQLATEAAITGGIAGGGEALVSTTSEGVRQAAGRLFTRLQVRYAQQRAGWLAGWLEQELLGDLLLELRQGAEVPRSQAFLEVAAAMKSVSSIDAE